MSCSIAHPRPARPLGDRLLFLARWLRNPRAIASITPSGSALAALITREIDRGPVLELGSGTGAFVPALLTRGIRERDLVLVERDAPLAVRLSQRWPDATVIASDAARFEDGTRFAATVCGLGLLNMPVPTVEAILRAAFARMQPGAHFYLFTYGRRCSVGDATLDRLDLSARRVGRTWRNLPPATVFCLSRRAEVVG
ncbi:class I SAM-dependent methyltransferase [Sphingomonas yantingensis]|uniref:Phospholipid N-methyltransferase n=1 Tax=Sphingomonas yantingensis TaxID=1241761 RepID=A0A7W9ARN2_9SPHN|nr:methyltransferase domain-containing protein [Sphingomonas yantingensis]MBB5699187.1 phospholipid N-methyltransferase [Sphingomonas yantingensis]